MSAGELSKRWRKESLAYVAGMNEYVRRGMQRGWDQAGEPPKESRQLLAPRVIDIVREANKIGELADLRERFPPAHSPFIEMLYENGQRVRPRGVSGRRPYRAWNWGRKWLCHDDRWYESEGGRPTLRRLAARQIGSTLPLLGRSPLIFTKVGSSENRELRLAQNRAN